MVTVVSNKFGDTLVTANGANEVPDDLEVSPSAKIVFQGYSEPPHPETRLLCTSRRYGPLFATEATHRVYPKIENDTMMGACAVVFVRHNGETFVVFVQVRGRPYAMNPAGHQRPDETSVECAARETTEETGLTVSDLRPLAVWEFNSGFGGLKWPSRTVGFYGLADCPPDWQLPDLVNRIDYRDSDGEVDHLIVARIDSLPGANVSELHLNLVREAYRRLNPLPYLTSFQFLPEEEQSTK